MKTNLLWLILLVFPAQAFSADMLSVAARQVNVRSGPGSGYEVVWRAVRHYPLQVLDSDGAWVRVSDYAHDEGWIYRSLLSEVPAVVVVTEKANVREGPGLEYDATWEVEKEYPLRVLEVEGNWYKVTDNDGLTGWLHKSVTWGFSGNSELEPQTSL